MSDLVAIINNEVPTAFFMGNFADKTKIGMIRNPPPTPTKPVINPSISPSEKIKGKLNLKSFREVSSFFFDGLIML